MIKEQEIELKKYQTQLEMQNNTTTKPLNHNKMKTEEIKNDISVKSRLAGMTDEQLKIIDFIIDYSFKDNQEIYTNGTILVPLFRVLDAIAQEGKEYQESC
jgi:hypothetical protein